MGINDLIKNHYEIDGKQIGSDQSLTWANSDAVNTQKTITFTKPTNGKEEYALTIHNPSTVTDLTVKVFNIEKSLGGADRESLVKSVVIAKSQTLTGTAVDTNTILIRGAFLGTDVKLIVSNDTVLGVSDGFTCNLRLRELV